MTVRIENLSCEMPLLNQVVGSIYLLALELELWYNFIASCTNIEVTRVISCDGILVTLHQQTAIKSCIPQEFQWHDYKITDRFKLHGCRKCRDSLLLCT